MDEQHLTIAETARRMREHLPEGESISESSISHYRTGRVIPRRRHLRALSLALGVEEAILAALADSATAFWPEPSSPAWTLDRPPRMAPMAARLHASNENVLRGPVEISVWVDLQDLGDEVYLKVDQRVPWAVALKVLELLKGKME